MGFFDFLRGGKHGAAAKQKQNAEPDEYIVDYSGMRVEVLDTENRLLFVARFSASPSGKVNLYQLSAGSVPPEKLPPEGGYLPVHLRGYYDRHKVAIHMNANISLSEDGVWTAEDVVVVNRVNDRAFFRQSVDIKGEVLCLEAADGQYVPCEMVNISAGGACIRTARQFEVGDKLILRVRLLPDEKVEPLACGTLRVTEKKKDIYEYGCKFIDLSPTAEDQIAKAIMEMQRRQMRR